MTERPHQLRCIEIGDDPAPWAAAGFEVVDGTVAIGATLIRCVGTERGRGIRAVDVAGLTETGRLVDLDGLRLGTAPGAGRAPGLEPAGPHENRVVALDHLVATSPDMDRTTAALVTAGLDHRRDRRLPVDGGTRRQAFFWLGDVILELVGDDEAHGPGPAAWWGLAMVVDDLDHAAAALGERLGRAREAVQAGRRIATLRTRDLDVSVPIALMTAHDGGG